MNKRLAVLTGVFTLFIAALLVRFFALQVMSADFYQNLSQNQHQSSKTLEPVRGEVYIHESRNGDMVPTVTNIEKKLVFAVPHEIDDKTKTARLLAKVLQGDELEIKSRISDQDRKWVAIARELDESTSLEVKNLELPGIYLEPETHRFYPEGSFASQTLGFVGYEEDVRKGQYGVERYFEEELSGTPGFLSLEKDTSGRWVTGGFRERLPAKDGADIYLTLDRAIQFKAEEIISRTVSIHQADSGAMIVMHPETGAVLAMANFPSFDPNNFSEVDDISVYRNNIVSDTYEPGSVFKPVTMSAALDAGVVTPDMTYEDKGAVQIDQYTIKNSDNKAHGVQTMTEVLEKSLNTGLIFVQDQLGAEKFLDAVKRYGFGEPTGIKLPAEAGGDISNLIGGGDVHYATASFGQGITVTMAQLAQAYATIANEGKLTTPYIVEKVVTTDGREEVYKPKKGKEVISSRAANTIGAMLVSAIENGHGKRAGVPGYYIAGKTGTAQVASSEGGYDTSNTIGTFAGFGPVDDPRFVIVVRVNNPKTVRFAESTAAPAFGEMAQFLLNYYQVTPNR